MRLFHFTRQHLGLQRLFQSQGQVADSAKLIRINRSQMQAASRHVGFPQKKWSSVHLGLGDVQRLLVQFLTAEKTMV